MSHNYSDKQYKKILILGFGVEGKDAYCYLKKKYPLATFAIADRNEIIIPSKNVKLFCGKNYLRKINDYDLILKSPGIPSSLKEIKKAEKNGAVITTLANIFFNECKGKIIGVTGTKGKSTTATLIYKILKEAKKDAYLVGNIGNTPLKYLNSNFGKHKIFVYELSSYQLSTLKKSPNISVFLSIFPDHMPYHGSFKNYRDSKANIAKFQDKNDYFIYNSGYEFIDELAKNSKGKTIDYKNACLIKDNAIYYGNEKIIYLKEIKLLGEHNIENIFACICVAKIFKIPADVISKAIKNFRCLEHRLELVGNYQGITFYDDAISTTPESTIAAIEVFKDKLGTIFLGGEDRGYIFSALAKKIADYNVQNIVLFPETGEKIQQKIIEIYNKKRIKLPRFLKTKSMEEAVKFAYKHTPPGRICLLSTASPSYSVFKNFIEKGNLFKEEVKKNS